MYSKNLFLITLMISIYSYDLFAQSNSKLELAKNIDLTFEFGVNFYSLDPFKKNEIVRGGWGQNFIIAPKLYLNNNSTIGIGIGYLTHHFDFVADIDFGEYSEGLPNPIIFESEVDYLSVPLTYQLRLNDRELEFSMLTGISLDFLIERKPGVFIGVNSNNQTVVIHEQSLNDFNRTSLYTLLGGRLMVNINKSIALGINSRYSYELTTVVKSFNKELKSFYLISNILFRYKFIND